MNWVTTLAYMVKNRPTTEADMVTLVICMVVMKDLAR